MADYRMADKMTSSTPPPAAGNRQFGLIRSFGHRNYRLFFMGQGISLIGTWMQNLALGWLVYKITGSELLLGVVGFSSQILTFAAAPFAGVLADRVNKRTLLVVTQSVALVQALILAILTLVKHADGTPVIQVWHIIALSALLGLVMGFDIPTRQSFVVEMLEDRADLPNAIALNSFMFNGARLIGPALADQDFAVAHDQGRRHETEGWSGRPKMGVALDFVHPSSVIAPKEVQNHNAALGGVICSSESTS